MIKSKELQEWMDRNGKLPIDVAAEAHVSQKTVERFLSGETTPTRVVMEAIERVVYPGQDKLKNKAQ